MDANADPGFETDVPARLDRLPWSRFHWLVVIALGVTWILDGLEVTLVGSLSGAIRDSPSLRLTEAGVGYTASAYLAGAVGGALLFGWAADRLGRRRLFTVTVLVYLVGSVGSGLAWDAWSFAALRCLTGAGIGGQYAAVNSAISELIPARWRGTTELAVNGTFWAGAALGAVVALVVLDPTVVSPEIGWRGAFVVGGALAVIIIVLRRHVPESPRWLMTHGDPAEASRIVRGIEADIEARHGPLPPPESPPMRLRRRAAASLGDVARTILRDHRDRAILALVLMAAQAFLYNAVFFTYALVLERFHGVPSREVGWFMLPFAIGNLAGALLLGPMFDSIGRRRMITATYGIAGVLMLATAAGFAADLLGAWGQTAAWTAIFFFASAAASAAYLTVGEAFPLELRAMAIALFYAVGTAVGGIIGPALFGTLIAAGTRGPLTGGYVLAALLMLGAAATAWRLGFAAERRSLESLAVPLSAARPVPNPGTRP